jgi:hypothetical protein
VVAADLNEQAPDVVAWYPGPTSSGPRFFPPPRCLSPTYTRSASCPLPAYPNLLNVVTPWPAIRAPPNLLGMEQLRGLAIRLAMDESVGDDLPMAAAHALTRGVDSPSLRELAGLSKGQPREAVDLFRQAMHELGCPVPNKSGARLHLMREAAANIVAGKGDPEDLAHEIYWQAYYSGMPELRAVGDRFLELYAGWGLMNDQAAAMAAAAQSFLRDHPADDRTP